MNAATLSRTFLSIALMLILAASLSLAQVPKTISYQGILTDASGTVVPDGNYNLTFRLYDLATGGTALWAEGQLVAVSKGIFNVILGSVAPLNLPFDKPYYLGVTVGAGTELSPRIPLTSSGYSFRAANTDNINGIPAGGDLTGAYPNPSIARGAVDSTKLADGAVTQAKLAPGVSLPPGGAAGGDLTGTYPNPTIANNAVTTAKIADGAVTSAKIAVPLSLSESSNDAIIQGTNSGSGDGLAGQAVTGRAVFGAHSSGNQGYLGGANYGVYGYTNVNRAVGGFHNATGNYGYLGTEAHGVYGSSGSGYGVYGYTATGTAVYGQHKNSGNFGCLGTSSYGVYGEAFSTNGNGVRGVADNGSAACGVWGSSTGGCGVWGSSSSSGYGVYGSSGSGYGVYGNSSSSYGVYGYSSTGIAVRAYKNGGGDYAGYFYGNVNVTGTLSKGGGSFKIDHPLDPANKYLYHSFVESPDMMNIYNGNVTLDANGEAWVELPAYFEALNKDFRYQLTAIGAPGPNLYIAQEISGNRFKIAGGSPGMKVSWQVTGIRHDPFAEAHRIQVEVEKTGAERGKYLYPKEYGVSETLGIDYEEHQKMEAEQARIKAEQERMKAEQERMQKEVKK
jgi:hypothetical protein